MTTPAPASAAGECGSYRSETVPPPTIRVFRTKTGAVETVDFRTYVKNVLSREWISSWTTESLRSGALAVKNYAWYQVIHWRGYVNEAGDCFDIFDSTRDQVYDPSKPTYQSMANAVDATWGTLAHKNGKIFATYYNAGASGEACGANANGWQMFQWGTQACGLAGKTAAQIMATYYTGVVIVAAPPAATPSPTPTPMPTAGANADAHAGPDADARRREPRRARPRCRPPRHADADAGSHTDAGRAPTPPQSPGGGQVGLVRPPAPPPPNPTPVVVTVDGAGGSVVAGRSGRSGSAPRTGRRRCSTPTSMRPRRRARPAGSSRVGVGLGHRRRAARALRRQAARVVVSRARPRRGADR